MLLRVPLVRIDVSEVNIESIISLERISGLGTALRVITNSFNPDDGGDNFLQIVDSYKSHAASHPRRRHSP
jgi:hypothetical protein